MTLIPPTVSKHQLEACYSRKRKQVSIHKCRLAPSVMLSRATTRNPHSLSVLLNECASGLCADPCLPPASSRSWSTRGRRKQPASLPSLSLQLCVKSPGSLLPFLLPGSKLEPIREPESLSQLENQRENLLYSSRSWNM